jgi:hypothetical protein
MIAWYLIKPVDLISHKTPWQVKSDVRHSGVVWCTTVPDWKVARQRFRKFNSKYIDCLTPDDFTRQSALIGLNKLCNDAHIRAANKYLTWQDICPITFNFGRT